MTTVKALICRMLPNGTRMLDKERFNETWHLIPLWPPDVFAVTANLIERSGAYRRLVEPADGGTLYDPFDIANDKWRQDMVLRAEAWCWNLLGNQNEPNWEEVKAHREAQTSFDPALLDVDLNPLREDWRALWEVFGDSEVLSIDEIVQAGSGAALPGWWKHALRLLITADTASAGIGFQPRAIMRETPEGLQPSKGEPNWIQALMLSLVQKSLKESRNKLGQSDPGYLSTLTSPLFDKSKGAVLPKTRTSTLGCSLRSLSHNLALLPAAGKVEARWRVSGERPIEATTRDGKGGVQKDLNLLLIPFPYRIPADAFQQGYVASDKPWGYFHVEQAWLKLAEVEANRTERSRGEVLRELGSFVANLARSAARGGQEVHGVIFPELALNAETFEIIAEQLREEMDDIGFEFIIAGMSEAPRALGGKSKTRPGNFAAFLGRTRAAIDGKYVDGRGWRLVGAREKHHRWKINKSQTRRYALSSALTAATDWWEGIHIAPRVVEFFEVRGGTSLTVMICEDLARSDPCQEVLRAIGPNLVVALLMDGPQRASRWPAHYAGVLADDPGSSVLTLTSLGLIERGLATDSSQSRSVAFFKDSIGTVREIPLPVDAHALLLSLEAKPKAEHTLDGRSDGGGAYIWHLNEVTPVRANSDRAKNWILGLG